MIYSLSRVSLRYGKKVVLHNISLEINAGEKIAIIGESGVGKSTLLEHLRILKPDTVAWCPQNPALVPVLSGFHNIYAGTLHQHSFFYNLRQLLKPSRREWLKILAVADNLDIGAQLSASVERLSGGQQQRVNIARALIQNKSIFLGDEPVSALDEFQRPQVLRTIAASCETCIFVLHDLDLALSCCERIIGLGADGILVDCRADDIDSEHLAQLFRHHQIPVPL